jgi:seryl-tRNA synthetase
MSDTLDRLLEMVSREKRATYDVGDWWNMADAAIEEMEQQARARALLEQEIEELRRQRDAYANEITGALLPANERLRAEIERLRSAGVGYSQQTVDAITQEREKLRAALKEIRHKPGADNATAYEMRLIASEALGHE